MLSGITNKIRHILTKCSLILCGLLGLSYTTLAFAADDDNVPKTVKTLGDMALYVTGSFTSFGQFLTAGAYLAGFILVVAAIFKFKQHKDNPTQIPMGTPVALLAIGIALIFFPSLIAPAGHTLTSGNPTYGGFTGSGITSVGSSST